MDVVGNYSPTVVLIVGYKKPIAQKTPFSGVKSEANLVLRKKKKEKFQPPLIPLIESASYYRKWAKKRYYKPSAGNGIQVPY